METVVINPDTNENINITVDEGPLPYSVQITFGASYTITLTNEDARVLAELVAAAASLE